ncbi:MAG: hypothetical protein IPI49_00540 [Myxococcales bacterium]|nr:hypothetical protein [Myxococcales bacterium]
MMVARRRQAPDARAGGATPRGPGSQGAPGAPAEALAAAPARALAAAPARGARWIATVAAFLVAGACGCAARPRVPVTLILEGEPAVVAAVRAQLSATSVPQLVVRHAALPPPQVPALGVAEVSAAFEDFLAGDGSRCRERLAAVDLPRLLAHRQRAAVARALLLDARCAEGLGNSAAADARFEEFASYELELAESTGVLSPTLRSRFDLALAKLGRAPRVRLEVSGAPGGRLWIDGRTAACALPCSPSLGQGAHVLTVEAEGFALTWRKVLVQAAAAVALPVTAASAEEAAAQWHARAGQGFAPDDARSLALLPQAVKDERIVYLRAGRAQDGLIGALVMRKLDRVDVAARGQRAQVAAAPQLVRQLAIDAGVVDPPRPRWFWPALAGSVLASAAITAVLLYQPEVRTQVEL